MSDAPIGRDMRWWGWGEDAHAGTPPEHGIEWLEGRLGGALAPERPPVALDDVELAPSRLDEASARALRAIVGDDGVRDDRATRVLRSAGRGYPDLVRLRAGRISPAPDAVVLPRGHADVRGVLEHCAAAGIAVVPFGGGTSVVGGVEPDAGAHAAVVTLDLSLMSQLLDVDEDSRLATMEPGMRGPEVEGALRERGYTLGHFPQSFEYATVGGWVATRSAGQASTGYGRIDELVDGLTLAAPAGDLAPVTSPASAAGPDLRQLAVGSEGALGVLTSVTLRVRPRPQSGRYEAWMLPSFEAGAEAYRELEQGGHAPDVARLSDRAETEMSLALAGLGGIKARAMSSYLAVRRVRSGSIAIVGWEGDEETVAERRRAATAVLRRHGGASLGSSPGRAWARGRFHAPYLRDDLLGRGVMVETLETATTWSNLEHLYVAVREALGEHAPLVACHISHLYPSGSSLYYTFLAHQEPGDLIGQWQRAKTAACEAIVGAGGTITHHHAIGRDHRSYVEAEAGAAGVEALRAAKRALDPAGIMNPGKLLA
jgi:alkyldihydroxyacetonephosphate synthase